MSKETVSSLLGRGHHWCGGWRGAWYEQPSLGGRGHGLTTERNKVKGLKKDGHPAQVPQGTGVLADQGYHLL